MRLEKQRDFGLKLADSRPIPTPRKKFGSLTLFQACDSDDDPGTGFSDFQESVILYFKEVALGFDSGDFSEITRKWREPMSIYLAGQESPALRNELENVVFEINELVTDGFELKLVSDSAQANYFVFLGTAAEYAQIYPNLTSAIEADPGLFILSFNQRAELLEGHMYVDIERVPEREQRHLLREGITQSIGLARDSDRVDASIFQRDRTDVTEYANIDRELIRLLYHPNMVVGLDEIGAEVIIREIFKKENMD